MRRDSSRPTVPACMRGSKRISPALMRHASSYPQGAQSQLRCAAQSTLETKGCISLPSCPYRCLLYLPMQPTNDCRPNMRGIATLGLSLHWLHSRSTSC